MDITNIAIFSEETSMVTILIEEGKLPSRSIYKTIFSESLINAKAAIS